MTPISNLLIANMYLAMAAGIGFHEYINIRRRGADSFTIVLAFVLIYLLIPSIGIHFLFGVYGADLRTGNFFFDKIYDQLNTIDALAVCLLTALFIAGLYLSAGLRRVRVRQHPNTTVVKLILREHVMLLGMLIGILICTKFFMGLGDGFIERYNNLVLFRNLDASIERTFFSANAFSLTQTFTWLASGVFFIYFIKGSKAKAVIFFIAILAFAFLMGSRRGLIFPILIIYFSFVIWNDKLYFNKVFLLIPPIIVLIGFGKEITGSFAYNTEPESVLFTYEHTGALLLRAFSDIGISQVESIGVLQYFDGLPRLGIDHLLSLLRRFPDGMLGLDIDWPERIVRITTETLATKDDADIPPGLIGQSWLDFPVIGALVWGLVIGIQSHFLDRWTSRLASTPAKAAVTTLLTFVIVLPLNTGSYDFTFSMDIISLFLLIILFFQRQKMTNRTPNKEADCE